MTTSHDAALEPRRLADPATGPAPTWVPPEQVLYVDHTLRVTCAVMPGPSVIRLSGEIDGGNSDELRRTLERARLIDDELIVDLAGVTFADVAAVRALRDFAAGGDVEVRNVPHQMRRLMSLIGLASL
ncbi:anti-sigma factor antagonist [Nonomuraea terrae]|uniref:Anti-sigma factor antagonist n=1 Tax=Nonomuraea terrae TaxID=2530383 RepID=A0A4R4Z021_9ACTN|nr:STAS domain-containing protein [Nonomuraea terrae]TDD51211.1 anti-sigma factor antagonist [Nonomuraea terrae]